MARNYRKEYDNYQGKPSQIKNRAKRNAARAEASKAGRVRKGDGKDVGHKRALIKGGGNSPSNTKIQTKSANRSFKRTKRAGMK